MIKIKIFVDADGCPVVKLAVALAREFEIPITLVKNYAHKIEDSYAQVVTVDTTLDSADFYIVNHASAGDLVITQDNGLAAMCIGKGIIVINQNGLIIDKTNIDSMLESRHINKTLRKRGIYKSKISKRKNSDNSDFERSLRSVLEKIKAERKS